MTTRLAARHQEPARARRGRRQIRCRRHRHHRPARYHPGRGADRKAQDLSGGDRRAQRASRQRYTPALADVAIVPRVGNESTSVWAQYTIRLAPGRRDALAAALKAQGIPTAIYYAKPLHRQPAYRGFPVADGGVPVSEQLAERSDQPADARLSRAAGRRTASSRRCGGRSRDSRHSGATPTVRPKPA